MGILKNSNLDYPKGYPVEHLLWISCPYGITSIADGVTLALEDIARRYESDVLLKRVPFIPDHGVPAHNVLGRLSVQDFRKFHERVCASAQQARAALDEEDACKSADLWRELFGDRFPSARTEDPKGDLQSAKR